ncbi:hypothetical protein L7F22_009400 [Adiantum nelumboides]|nr:hypothetical protein [Adiantum nelumboides]
MSSRTPSPSAFKRGNEYEEERKPVVAPKKEEDEDVDRSIIPSSSNGAANTRAKSEDEEEFDREGADSDDEEEEDEEEDEEDEEDDEDRGGGRRRKRRRQGVSRFVDVEAVVDDDEEEYDEEDPELVGEDGFIEQDAEGDDGENFQRRTAAGNQALDLQRRREEELDAEQIAAQLRERYRSQRGFTAQSDYEEVPQTLLMPSVNDPGLYAVRCRPGREKVVIQTILRKAFNPGPSGPLKIISAFSRDTLPGRIYVEATESKHVVDACSDVASAFARGNSIFLVPINEMADLLKITKTRQELKPGGYVRFKSGKYAGDLAQVIDTSENGELVGVRFIPRLDLDPKEDEIIVDRNGKKRKKSGRSVADRPPQRFFNAEEVRKKFRTDGITRRDANTFIFRNQTYINGYCEDDVSARRLITENINPTLDEISRFTGESINGSSGGAGSMGQSGLVNLNLLADATQRKADIVLRKDDHVEVFEGEQSGVEGVIETVEADVVTIRLTLSDLEDQTIEVPIRSVRKKFRPGDHIKVITGKHRDETGLVVKVEDNVTTFLSDLSLQEVSVFSNDIHEAAEVGSGVNTIGGYELHDLVQLDAQTAGVIFKIEREVFMILDQTNAIRSIKPNQITMKRDSGRAVAVDSEGGEFRTGDTMKEVDGEERVGTVLHVYQSTLIWLFNRDTKENGGVFLTRANKLRPRAPRGVAKPNLSKMNPALTTGTGIGQSGQNDKTTIGGAISNLRRPGGRDPLAGKTVSIVKGPYKTYRGIIKDTNGPTARVELHSISKILTIGLDCLIEKDPYTGKSKPLIAKSSASGSSGGFNDRSNNYNRGGGYSGQATNPYVTGAATPAHNPYVTGSKTPAYNMQSGSKTPAYNMYDGSKTPAYGNSLKTPAYNPYVSSYNDGSKTPAYSYGGDSSRNMAPPSVRRPEAAPTPMIAPTPGGEFSAPTPGMYSAPTPGAAMGGSYGVAPTPGGLGSGVYGAPTPNPLGAPTPAGGMLGAATPYTPATQPRGYGGGAASGWDAVGQDHPLLEGILVRIKKGKHEGKTGYVKSAYGNGESGDVVLEDSSRERLDKIGKDYVEPLQPTGIRTFCLALSGEYRGKKVLVQSLDGREVMGLVEGKNAFFDVRDLARMG